MAIVPVTFSITKMINNYLETQIKENFLMNQLLSKK